MPLFDQSRLAQLFGSSITHDAGTDATSLTHGFGNESFLAGHFPGYPVVPGVILLDGMIYAAFCSADRIAATAGREINPVIVESVAFYRPVLPGMVARFSARLDARDEADDSVTFKCSVAVGTARHARATITLFVQRNSAQPVH